MFSWNNSFRIKDGAYVIKLDNKKGKVTHWVSLFIVINTAVYCDCFGIKYIPEKVLNKIRDILITHNIFRIQDNDSVLCVDFVVSLP